MSNNKLKFDEEELQILRDFERGEFESIKNFQNEKNNLRRLLEIHSAGISVLTFVFPLGI